VNVALQLRLSRLGWPIFTRRLIRARPELGELQALEAELAELLAEEDVAQLAAQTHR